MTLKPTPRGFAAFAARLGSLSRFLRIVIAALMALIFTAAAALLVYNVLFQIRPDQITDAQALLTGTLIGLAVFGFGLYWLGWRLLVGFDFGETPLQPGPAAAIYVLFGLITLIVMVVLAAFAVVEALLAA